MAEIFQKARKISEGLTIRRWDLSYLSVAIKSWELLSKNLNPKTVILYRPLFVRKGLRCRKRRSLKKNGEPQKSGSPWVELFFLVVVNGSYDTFLLLRYRAAVPKRTNARIAKPHSPKVGTGSSGFTTQSSHCVNNVPSGVANT